MMFCKAVDLPECLDKFLNISQICMCKGPSIVMSSLRSYIYNCKFITSIYQRQQNNRKTVFVIGKLVTGIWCGLNLHLLSFDGINAISEVPQVPKVIHDL